ncbi:hypothetical protein L484_003396 [Morus notabilis]|uniref:Endonuclease/exonuclease/phosphatase domain-containing protein n=1 Tax=Morus notabilis TaxID=981085 RepID=W9RM33_9ROSA|nr:hypothetical protein L484_003396 [Morus notabilis]
MNILEESDDEKFECQVVVMLPSRTPVVGIEINPNSAFYLAWQMHMISHSRAAEIVIAKNEEAVQSDHFESFFEPELAKRGYSAMYKKKTKELYTANRNIMDGCATFYRSTLFKETAKYELEFDKTALAFVEALEPQLRSEGSFRLLKGNGMLVAILEIRDNERFCDVFPSRICVIVSLINRLEEIVHPQIPLLICGDFNSLPTSDSYTFVVTVSCDIVDNEKQDPLGIFNHQRLQHSLHLASAYASFSLSVNVEDQLMKMDLETNEPLFTNFTRSFSGTLDYIFYSVNSLRVEDLWSFLIAKASVPVFHPLFGRQIILPSWQDLASSRHLLD